MKVKELIALLKQGSQEAEVEIEVYGDLVWPTGVFSTFRNNPNNKYCLIETSVSKETPELTEAKEEAKKYKDIVSHIYRYLKEKY